MISKHGWRYLIISKLIKGGVDAVSWSHSMTLKTLTKTVNQIYTKGELPDPKFIGLCNWDDLSVWDG